MSNSVDNTSANSPVLRHYAGLSETVVSDGMQVASGGPGIDTARDVLVDLSALGKRLLVGRGAYNWLQSEFGGAPDELFACVKTVAGADVVQLHYGQYLVIDPVSGDAPGLDAVPPDGVVMLPYDALEFALLGPHLDKLYTELSATDPDRLATDRWYPTRFAHAEVGVRLIDVPVRHLRVVASPADADFLFGVVNEMVSAEGGALTTLDAYQNFTAAGAASP